MDADTTYFVDISDIELVEDDGVGKVGKKNTKPERFDLLPWDALEEVARVYDFGSRKYAERNWELGYSWSLSYQALVRHIVRFWLGEDKDPESGLSHMAHATFHCLCLLSFILRGAGVDNRPEMKKR